MKWTLLRHQVLAAIAAGRVTAEADTWQVRGWRPSTPAQVARACNWLWECGALDVLVEGRGVEITEAGRRTLSRWDERHPEVMSSREGQ